MKYVIGFLVVLFSSGQVLKADEAQPVKVMAESGCLGVSAPAISPSQWWVTLNFSISNSCSTAQSASGVQLLVTANQPLRASALSYNSINGLYFPPPIYWAPTSISTSDNGSGGVIITLNTSGYVPANSTTTVQGSFGYNPNGTMINTMAVSLQGGGTPPPPQNLGALNVSIDASALLNTCTTSAPCSIPINVTGLGGQYNKTLTTVTGTSSSGTYTLNGLTPGTYVVAAGGGLPTGVTSVVSPSAGQVNVAAGQTASISVGFTVATTTGTLNFIPQNPNSGLFTQKILPASIVDPSGSATLIEATLGQLATASNLLPGSYSIAIPGLGNPATGVYYTYPAISAQVGAASTTALGDVTAQTTSGAVRDVLTIKGLAVGESAQITFADPYGKANYIYNSMAVTSSNATSFDVPFFVLPTDTLTITIAPNTAKYAPVGAINVNQGSTPQNFTVVLSPAPLSPYIFSPYKDVGINANWNTYVISTQANSQNKSPTVPMLSVLPSGVKAVTWAFATGSCGNESWAGIAPQTLADANIPLFKNANVNYIISTGGAAGTFTCDSNSKMEAFVKRYYSSNMIGLDFDIEGGGLTQAQLSSLMSTLKYVQSKYPTLRISFTLPTLAGAVTPGKNYGPTLTYMGEAVINNANAVGLNYILNLMVMDYGSPSDQVCIVKSGKCDMGASAIQAAKSASAQYQLPLSRIELTPMIGVNDVIGETFSLDKDAPALKQWAIANALGGLHIWSFDRDTQCATTPNPYASPICSGVSQTPFAFMNAIK